MQTARGDWFVGAGAAPAQVARHRIERARTSRREAPGRAALAAVLALSLLGSGVLAGAIAVVSRVYTPLF